MSTEHRRPENYSAASDKRTSTSSINSRSECDTEASTSHLVPCGLKAQENEIDYENECHDREPSWPETPKTPHSDFLELSSEPTRDFTSQLHTGNRTSKGMVDKFAEGTFNETTAQTSSNTMTSTPVAGEDSETKQGQIQTTDFTPFSGTFDASLVLAKMNDNRS
ncbi:hypothetical protein sscle_01g000310 [Sclerotinia sclerotiorum 1980 UF-70]|uniref:Uncharacterized protein n=1 Tax=Sclerotinia sclerotiorum (strain ATCC 18683 / 1980 / Ss-1) TaxID=665079 RepID=A0A1D9PR85_SCLS1|nr:hypothetical protein sscle_01g000310 [Sclerotinia sclerotiorum 1980 UF-70]